MEVKMDIRLSKEQRKKLKEEIHIYGVGVIQERTSGMHVLSANEIIIVKNLAEGNIQDAEYVEYHAKEKQSVEFLLNKCLRENAKKSLLQKLMFWKH